jgi:hypothetical protein
LLGRDPDLYLPAPALDHKFLTAERSSFAENTQAQVKFSWR